MSALQSAELELVLGPIQVGYTIATFLFGLTTIQSYIYFQGFPEDQVALKSLVAIVWLADLGHQLCAANVVETLFVTSFGDVSRVFDSKFTASCGVGITFGNFIFLCVQSFFAHRTLPWISTLGINQRITRLAIRIIPFIRFGASIVPVPFLFWLPLPVVIIRLKPIWTSIWIFGAASDVILTFALIYGLHFQRNSALRPTCADCERDTTLKLPLHRTSRLIDRLIIGCVTTSLITSICMVTLTICFLIIPYNFIWVSIFLAAPRFFSNSMLATLNYRTRLRRMNGSPSGSSTLNVSWQLRSIAVAGSNSRNDASNQRSSITETTMEMVGPYGNDAADDGVVEDKDF